MSAPLYLTPPEQTLFSRMDEATRARYQVIAETTEGFETVQQMDARLALLASDEYADVQKAAHDICTKLAETGELDGLPADMTEGSMEALLFLVGARGLSDMILSVLNGKKAAEAADAAATLSVVRHALIETNLASRR